MSRENLACKVYVGDLARDASERDIEKEFSYYGKLKKVWVARNPPGFAFVEYEDARDAEDAISGLDGTTLFGSRIRVEPSSDRSRQRSFRGGGGRGRGPPRYDNYRGGGGGGRHNSNNGRPFDSDDKCYQCGERGHYAYDCKNSGGGGGGYGGRRGGPSRGRERSRSRSPRRSYSRSRSRSGGRRNASRSASKSPRRD